MTYTQPTLAQLRDKVEQDLRDSSNEAFSAAEVDDLINEAIVEVNRIYPLAQIEDVDIIDTDEDGNVDRTYSITSTEVQRAEVWRDGGFRENIPEFDSLGNSGYDIWGSTLTLPTWVVLDEDVDTVKLYGYADREYLSDDADIAEFDSEAEYAVRSYAKLRGYQALQNDRTLYQQWMKVPGNNDISPTQLDSFVNTYIAQWERQRGHLRRLRR
jgi:hypothetical protein